MSMAITVVLIGGKDKHNREDVSMLLAASERLRHKSAHLHAQAPALTRVLATLYRSSERVIGYGRRIDAALPSHGAMNSPSNSQQE